MTVTELTHEMDKVDLAISRTHEGDMDKLIARGIWEVALQLAKLNEGVEKCQ